MLNHLASVMLVPFLRQDDLHSLELPEDHNDIQMQREAVYPDETYGARIRFHGHPPEFEVFTDELSQLADERLRSIRHRLCRRSES